MNPYERQKQRIMKKLHHQQLQSAQAFQSQNSQIDQFLESSSFKQSHNNYMNQSQTNQNIGDQFENRTNELRQNLILIHQHNILDRVFVFINQKVFWLKFFVFRKISSQKQIKKSNNPKQEQVIQKLSQNMHKNSSQDQLKHLVFTKLKQVTERAHQNRIHKANFFTKYVINVEYTKLCFAFLAIKSYASEKNSLNKVQKEERHVKFVENKQKLIKFEKQSKKFRAKSLFITIRNFMNKKYVKSSFNTIKFSKSQQYLQIHKQNHPSTNNDSKYQSKDARFIKKKVLPHKIIQENTYRKSVYNEANLFNLDHISFGNYEVKTVKKKHIQMIYRLHKIYQQKIIACFSHVFSILSLFISQNPKIHKMLQFSQQQDSDYDFIIVQNIMKSMCYLSSKTHHKRMTQKQKQKRKLALILMKKVINKNLIQNLSSIFYSLKFLGLNEYSRITRRIKQLQTVKQHCLEYFDNSLMQTEQNDD